MKTKKIYKNNLNHKNKITIISNLLKVNRKILKNQEKLVNEYQNLSKDQKNTSA